MIQPTQLKKWFFLIAILYLIFPRDLIPDYVGRGLGLVDDATVMALLVYYFRRYVQRFVAHQAAQQAAGQGGASAGSAGAGGEPGAQQEPGPRPRASTQRSDPHSILGVASGASQDEIRTAYRARMREYHPDKVAHLGDDLQKLAHDKSLEIQRAYKLLKR